MLLDSSFLETKEFALRVIGSHILFLTSLSSRCNLTERPNPLNSSNKLAKTSTIKSVQYQRVSTWPSRNSTKIQTCQAMTKEWTWLAPIKCKWARCHTVEIWRIPWWRASLQWVQEDNPLETIAHQWWVLIMEVICSMVEAIIMEAIGADSEALQISFEKYR